MADIYTPDLITNEDMITMLTDPINHSFTDASLEYFNATVLPKFESFREKSEANHVIDPTLYDTVHTIGDIHSDFRKFLQIISDLNLITLPAGVDLYSDTIYDPRIICDTVWNVERTLLVLVGDLIDGSRGLVPDRASGTMVFGKVVNDRNGSFEFLLHCFLYNMRMKAKNMNSELGFTLGNHEMFSVYRETTELYAIGAAVKYKNLFDKYLYTYVHPTTWTFLNIPIDPTYITDPIKSVDLAGIDIIKQQRTRRKELLDPFYKNSPYIMLFLENDAVKEAAFIHGGFHDLTLPYIPDTNYSTSDYLQRPGVIQIQESLTLSRDITNTFTNPQTSIWQMLNKRDYMEKSGFGTELCDKTRDSNFTYKKIIVGHCPTGMSAFNALYGSPEREAECGARGTTGCVLSACTNPKIIFTDTGLSQAFSMTSNQNKQIEVLTLTKNPNYNQPGNNLFIGGRRRKTRKGRSIQSYGMNLNNNTATVMKQYNTKTKIDQNSKLVSNSRLTTMTNSPSEYYNVSIITVPKGIRPVHIQSLEDTTPIDYETLKRTNQTTSTLSSTSPRSRSSRSKSRKTRKLRRRRN